MGTGDAARPAEARAALFQMDERCSTSRRANHSANRPGTHEESGMTSTFTLALRARNANRSKPRYQICLIHPFDPRGQTVRRLETYTRDFLTCHATDTDILRIAMYSRAELRLGRLHRPPFRRPG